MRRHFSAGLCLLLAVIGQHLLTSALFDCGDWHPRACSVLLDAGGCAFAPSISRRACGSSCGWCVVDGNSWTTAEAAELLARFPVLGGGRGGRGGDDADGGGGGGGEGGGNGKRRTQSRRIPGGFRPEPAAASATRWRSIPRVPPNISWAEFTEFQQRGVPVIFEGWLAHAAPELVRSGVN